MTFTGKPEIAFLPLLSAAKHSVLECWARSSAKKRWAAALSCFTLAAAGLAGCAQPQGVDTLPLGDAPRFTHSIDDRSRQQPSRWWTVFDDKKLEAAIDNALADNFTLAAAWQRLRAARAIADRESADLWPTLDGVGSAQWSESFGDGGDDFDDFNGDGDTEFSLGLEAGYEVDLWGRIESRVEAERLRAQATAADYRTAALTLAAEVTRTWYRLAEAQQQIDILERQIETNESVVTLLEDRFAAGQVRSADVLRQRQLVEATREQMVLAQSRRALLKNQLAVLLGQPPQADIETPGGELPVIAPPPRVGLPAELVERRPDVRQARLRLEAANRDLAAAVADQYPRINLTASLISTAEDPGGLFEDWLASLTGQIVAPLFDAGQRRAEVNRAEAVTRQRVAEYGRSVLTAFREVEDALAAERFDTQRIDRLEEQLRLSNQTLEQLRTQYLNGVTDYIAVLTALTQQQQLQRDLVASQLARLDSRIALYRALAGPFETPRERVEDADSPTPDGAAAEHADPTQHEKPHE